MKIQQHDGVVVDAAVFAAGLRQASARGRGVAWEREAPKAVVCCPPSPPLYRPPGGVRSPRRWDLQGGGGGGGQGGRGCLAPQGKGKLPP